MSELIWTEVSETVKKARISSAPGPSGIPYQVYMSEALKTFMDSVKGSVEERIYIKVLSRGRGLPNSQGKGL